MPREIKILEITTDKGFRRYYIKDMNGDYALWFGVNPKDTKRKMREWSEVYHIAKGIINGKENI